jgi:hypothetical protein
MGAKPNIDELMSLFIVTSMAERGGHCRRARGSSQMLSAQLPPDCRSIWS